METHVKSFLTRTSAHGFAHLQSRSSRLPLNRVVWALVIAASFATSSYVIWSSLEEVNDNPVSTFTNYVPVQEVDFPSVTIATQTLTENKLYDEFRQQFRLDCLNLEDDELSSCLNKTQAFRSLLAPAYEAILKRMFAIYLEVMQDHNGTYWGSYMRRLICSTIRYEHGGEFANMFYPLLGGLMAIENKGEDVDVDKIIGVLAANFKLPIKIPLEMLQEKMVVSNNSRRMLTIYECFDCYDKLSTESKTLAILLIKLYKDDSSMTLAMFHKMLDLMYYWYYIPVSEDFWASYFAFNEAILNCTHLYDASWQIPAFHMWEYLDNGTRGFKTNFSHCDFMNGGCQEECCTLKEEMQLNYDKILRLKNNFNQPLSLDVKTKGEQGYLDLLTSCQWIPKEYATVLSEDFTHVTPALVNCEFLGKQDSNNLCGDFTQTFTTNGLGHSFNADNLYNIFNRTPAMDAFCHELVQDEDNACSSKRKVIDKVLESGPDYSLRLLLHSPHQHRYNWLDQKLAIHASKSVPNMKRNFIETTTGTYMKISVSPRVTETEDVLQKQDSCHSNRYDDNPLKLFVHYSRENCLYECNINIAKDECGCVNWKVPRLPGETICAYADSLCFQKSMNKESNIRQCSHCVEECDKVEYEYDVQTRPIGDICKAFPTFKKGINKVVNTRGDRNYIFMREDVDRDGSETHIENPCYSYAINNFAFVDIYVGPSMAVKITRRKRVTFLQQVANLGGMVALFTGMSIISMVELVIWLIEVPWLLRLTDVQKRFFDSNRVKDQGN